MSTALPRIGVLSLGGTIASTPGQGAGVHPRLDASELVAAVPELGALAVIEPEGLFTKPSGDLALADVTEVDRRARAMVDGGCRAVVVTQGTDTLEEMSFAVDLLWDRDEPVVFTGAMRNPAVTGSDGPANLLGAVQVAVAPASRGRGVLVVMNDEIHAARFVVKVHTSSLSAFSSVPNGPIGAVSEGRASFTVPLGRTAALAAPVAWDGGVELVVATMGGATRLLECLAPERLSGLVLAGFGGGHVPGRLVPVVDRLVAAVPVVLASRVEAGRTLESTYGFPGGEIDLLGRGLLPAGGLNPLKARILLAAILSTAGGRSETEATFRRSVRAYEAGGPG